MARVSEISFKRAGVPPYLQKMSLKTARARHLPPHSRLDFGGKLEGAQKLEEAGVRLLRIYEICAGAGQLVTKQRPEGARGLAKLFPVSPKWACLARPANCSRSRQKGRYGGA